MKHTLYKRNVNGSINTWSIIIDEDGYYTEYGQLNGKLVTSDKVFVEAKNIGKKNETTIQQQAISEAEAIIYTKINSENFKENILDIDNIYFNPPMLAKEYKSYNKDIKSFPKNILAGMFGFEEKEYFEAKESSNEVPEVSFE